MLLWRFLGPHESAAIVPALALGNELQTAYPVLYVAVCSDTPVQVSRSGWLAGWLAGQSVGARRLPRRHRLPDKDDSDSDIGGTWERRGA
jgi:hypothetical protein